MPGPHLTADQLRRVSLTVDELDHLAVCPTCTAERDVQTFAALEPGQAFTRPPTAPPRPTLPALPDAIGPWRPTAVLGQGGMGVVYRATHRDTGAQAAVKTLARVDPFRARSLRREVSALASVDHPGVVRILDDGVQDGRPWYAMALVDGVPLDQVMRDRDRALRALARVCRTLAWLHGEGLVHLDMKPANVLLSDDDRPVLVDFGLVARTRDAQGQALLEQADVRAGTARYIAPERIEGHTADARADLYAVGCMVYEALTGRSPLASSAFDPLNAHVRDAPWPPSWLVDVAPELELLVLRLLAKDPRRRPGYAADVADAIDAVIGEDPLASVLPVPRPSVYRPPLVGRDADRAWLRATLADHRVAVVSGPHGIGKTRLVAELLAEVPDRRTAPFAATCPPTDAPPLVGLRPVLEVAVDRALAGDRSLPGASALATLVPDVTRLPGVVPDAEPPSTDVLVAHVFAAVEVALDGASGLLAIDDVHGADPLTLQVLARLVRSDDAPDLRVVATWATERAHPEVEALVVDLRLPVRQLGRLDADGTTGLAQGMLAATAVDPAVSRALHRRSGGNPRFAEELLRAAVLDGRLARDLWGRWTVKADALADQVLPASMDAVLAGRLAALTPAGRALAARAAVLVGPFPEAALAALGDAGALPELRARSVLEVGPQGWRFPHEALRSAAAGGLDDDGRRAANAAAAAWYDALPEVERTANLAVLARHRADAGDREGARLAAVEAGVAARKQHMLPRAGTLCRWAVSLEQGLPDLHGWMARLVVACADHAAGAPPASVWTRLAEVRRAADRATAWDLAAAALLAESWVLRTRWDPARAPGFLATAERLEPRMRADDRAALLHDLGVVHLRRGDHDAARAALAQSLEAARDCGAEATALRALESTANLALRDGDLGRALQLHGEVVRGWEARGNPVMVAVSQNNQAIPMRVSGRFERALELHAQAEHTLARVGQTLYAVHAATQQIENLLQLGRHDEAWERATAVLARPGTALSPKRVTLIAQQARAAGGRGDLEAARRCTARALAATDPRPTIPIQLLPVRRLALAEPGVARATWHSLADHMAADPRLCIALAVACAHEALWAEDDPSPWLDRARTLADPQCAGGVSADYLSITGLERAVAAAGAGEPLLRGSAVGDVPLPLRARLFRDGEIPRSWVTG